MAKDKDSAKYLADIKQQTYFTIPMLNKAIAQAKAGGTLATGNFSKFLEGKPWIGQAATDLERTLDGIKSNIGFGKLEQLKRLSQSGASGLGAVSNFELNMLQSTLGSISRDQSKDNLVYQLETIKNFYEKDIFEILAREAEIKGITDIDSVIRAFENQKQGGEKSPAELAADELKRRREDKGGG
jgi:hypothetical protein